MLKTEQNTTEMQERILDAAKVHGTTYTHGFFSADFEHGQWWLTCGSCGAQWSVCDAVDGPAVDGFDFEEVTQGDEEGHDNA
jgi:hypothetical protein